MLSSRKYRGAGQLCTMMNRTSVWSRIPRVGLLGALSLSVIAMLPAGLWTDARDARAEGTIDDERRSNPDVSRRSGGALPVPIRVEVVAVAETAPVPSSGDAADDPAIWIHPTDPANSIIIGTDKKSGLVVYSLTGRIIQYLDDGLMVNVDVRNDFPLGGQLASLVTAGNRANDTLAIYTVDAATQRLRNVASRLIGVGLDVYGSCMYRSPVNQRFYVFVTSKSGRVEQWELFDDGHARVDAGLRRTFDVGKDVEGCVADDELGHLYIGEEQVGIWKYAAEPAAPEYRELVDRTGSQGYLTADVEGLAIYYGANGSGFLIASSQGSDEFVLYQRGNENDYVMSFSIKSGNGIDEVTHADGIDVVSSTLGQDFPRGLFVAQDDRNPPDNQNFKLVSWAEIADLVRIRSVVGER